MPPICAHGTISGRVQGVWFRGFVKQQAQAQQLSGWAKNLADGRVEVLLYGAAQNIDAVVKNLHRGSPMSRVDSVDIGVTEDYEPVAGFRIL